MKLFNTLTKQIEEFVPQNSPKVTLYACGPTVYDFAHIGNFRTYVMTDLLVRALKYFDYEPLYVMNITDVGHLVSDSDTGEDKLEKGSRREGKSAWEIAAFYTSAFLSDWEKLNLLEPDFRPKPTEHIAEQIAMVRILLEQNAAYRIGDGIYFDTARFSGYGALTGQNPEELKAGARVEVNPDKRNPADFALWKFSPLNEKRQMEWDSPWGKGFPGWHIECSALSRKYLGDTIDIHTGGVDLIPVHHTNEIAQSETATGKKPFVRYWVHGQFIQVDGEKMSKSLGNFYSLKDIIKRGYEPLSLRYLYLTAHYRAYLNFTWQALDGSKRSLRELRFQVSSVKRSAGAGKRLALSPEKLAQIDGFRQRFDNALASDLNLPQALAVVWETVKSNIPAADKFDLIMSFDRVLGLNLDSAADEGRVIEPDEVPGEIRQLLVKRAQLRSEGKYEEADRVREEIIESGYQLEDTPKDVIIRKIQ